MFLRSVVLGYSVIVASASILEQTVDDADTKTLFTDGVTLEPVSQCPATFDHDHTFHHDGLRKDRLAQATFFFDPPFDGCYVIEERTQLSAAQWGHFQSGECEVSKNTKVHVHYCKGLQALGTVDQTPKVFQRLPQDQWTYIAALPFYKGHPGNVTLSNEGTEPGTLTMFDQVRFSWSGEHCAENHAHPRRVEIRITVDFENIVDRFTIFGVALKKKLADLAGMPDNALRLVSLRPGSIIAEFLVMPTIIDNRLKNPEYNMHLLQAAVSTGAHDICAITNAPFEGCNVEFKDLGFAIPSVKNFKPTPMPQPQIQQQQAEGPAAIDVIIACCTVVAFWLLIFVVYRFYMARKAKTTSDQSYQIKVQSQPQSMEEGHSVEEKQPVEEDADKSTICPSIISDSQSEIDKISVAGDIENEWNPQTNNTSIVKVISKGSQKS